MSKLPDEHRFFDLSDYGRPVARFIVRSLFTTRVSSIHITVAFLVAGLLGVYAVYRGALYAAAILLIVKNILDAADGEMARARKHPSHIGRYLDSIFDYLINLALCFVIFLTTGATTWLFILSFVCIQFQGTIFNYYYLVQRTLCSGDVTSKINEFERPKPFEYEDARLVRALHSGYLLCYGPFDYIMLRLENRSVTNRPLPNWFMTLVSSMGLGFQILLIALMLVLGRVEYILPFFVLYTVWGLLIIAIREVFVAPDKA